MGLKVFICCVIQRLTFIFHAKAVITKPHSTYINQLKANTKLLPFFRVALNTGDIIMKIENAILDFKIFTNSEDGAVTVDWVVLTAGVVGLGAAAAASVGTGAMGTSDTIVEYLDQDFPSMHKYGINRISNGSFEDIAGMAARKWGFFNKDGSLAGWLNEGDARLEVTPTGRFGVTSSDGDMMLDMDASPGNVRIGQILESAIDGNPYIVSFDAADPTHDNGVEVYFGGELIASVFPGDKSMTSYSYEIFGGSGNGNNVLTIGGIGPEDYHGVYLDNIEVTN